MHSCSSTSKYEVKGCEGVLRRFSASSTRGQHLSRDHSTGQKNKHTNKNEAEVAGYPYTRF